MSEQKRLFIRTWGCQMNVYDSVKMADVLAPMGYVQVEEPDGADLILLNTCHIREKAAEKVYSEIGRLKKLKDAKAANGGRMLIGVAGCVAQAEGEEILARAPAVDLVFGPQTYHKLPEMVAGAGGARLVNTDFPVESKFDHLPEETLSKGPSAFLSVQEGCDKFCTFCVVPYTRGAEFSRPVTQVLAEARALVAGGSREITLLGQNVNAYHGEAPEDAARTWGLARLIRELADIEGLERIRFTTSHPRDMDDELIAAHGQIDKLMPYLHLPVQSGSDRILEAMNRKHGRDAYFAIIDRLREARPDLAMSGDFIVGFPGETDADFEQTMDLVRRVGYAQAYSFKYSERPGTPAPRMGKPVPEDVKSERLAALQALLNEQQAAFNASKTGTRMRVLMDRKGKTQGQLQGRSPWMQSVFVEADARLYGHLVTVDITQAGPNSLKGCIVTEDVAGASAHDATLREQARVA